MNWAAYFQADDEMRHTIAIKKLKHQAEYEIEKFVARMTNPEVGVWFCWVEETDANASDTRPDDAVL